MPMVLRTRRSLVPDGPSAEVEFQPTQRRRRSNRRQQRQNYEEEAEETESVPGEVMERHEAELEEEAAEEADLTNLKDCSVILDRLHVDEGALKKELEEKEDMNRKGGKPVSRIPTFQKRPGGPTTELPAPRREAQPSERGGGGGAEGFKPLPEAREGALPLPSVRVPALGFVAASVSGGVEQAAAAAAGHTSEVPAPRSKSQSEPAQGLLMVASPRPPLRPEQDPSGTPRTEAGSTPDGPPSSLPQEGSLSQKVGEERAEIVVDASGDGEKTEEAADAGEVGRVEAIMDEEPPWETETVETAELRASACSSDAECDGDVASEASEGQDSQGFGEDEEWLQHQTEPPEPGANKPAVDDCTSSMVEEKSAQENPTEATQRSTRSGFSLFLLLLLLLLLGGLGLHVWRYGLPTSAAQLAAQLELQRLEGLAFMPEPCGGDCRVQLVESVPVGLYPSSPPSGPSVADGWLRLLGRANGSVHIAAFYFTLRDGASSDPPDSQGREVFEQLKRLEAKGVKLQIAVNAPQSSRRDTADLAATGAQVREVDLDAVTGGIVHTKLWVVDQKHFYVGSANMDWRSLSQVKEVGLTVEDCSCLAQDAFRIFGVYWTVGGAAGGALPPFWPARLSALSSADRPLHLKFNGVPARVYLSSAPPPISARGRSDDLATILSVIDDAQRFIHISVMDYLPMSRYTKPERFWPAIDSRLRAAACARGVQVRLMVSCWEHSPASMFPFLQSLLVLRRHPLKCNIDVKVFTVPSTAEQEEIPFARVNHAKYMVTDRVLYIGTSNWSENYFTHTAGVGLVVNQTGSAVEEGQRTLQSQAEELFLRDWSSDYASALPLDNEAVCPSAKREPF
ncbi:uncharacterized protein pld7 [Fundulus diaphanus]